MIDAVESWLAGQSFWVQIPILLAICLPLCWLLAGAVDLVVDRVLRRHTRYEQSHAAQPHPAPGAMASTHRAGRRTDG